MKKPSTRLLEGAWLSCGALVVRIGFGLFLTPYMLSALGDQSYGVFALASLFAGWCGLLDFGLTTTTSRFVTRCYTRQDWRGMNEIGSTAIVLFGGISGLVFLTSCAAYERLSLLDLKSTKRGRLERRFSSQDWRLRFLRSPTGSAAY